MFYNQTRAIFRFTMATLKFKYTLDNLFFVLYAFHFKTKARVLSVLKIFAHSRPAAAKFNPVSHPHP